MIAGRTFLVTGETPGSDGRQRPSWRAARAGLCRVSLLGQGRGGGGRDQGGDRNESVFFLPLDLATPIRRGRALLPFDLGEPLHVLVNNAGWRDGAA